MRGGPVVADATAKELAKKPLRQDCCRPGGAVYPTGGACESGSKTRLPKSAGRG